MVGSSNPSIWGTWEDLLLAYAVRRHGTDRWDSVAAELRHRSSYGHLLNPRCCHLRFNQLHRRFSTGNPFADTLEAPSDVPWLEDLRRLRVAELRRDVQRYDASIMSLQKKVKTLTEEACETPGSGAGDPDRISYRSSKESNMADPDQEARREPDPAADGSCHGSTATEVKESGDAQSSACLTNRWSWRRRKETSPEKELEGGPITVETTKMKSQPLMLFLEMITSDKLCSVFMRKLESQMSEKYEQVIRRHMDLETVREQLLRDQQGAYITIHMYRDLLLICNNAIVFYTKASREYSAALHLRHLCTPRHHISMPTLLACGRQRETALEPVTVKVKTKEKAKNKKVARKTKNKKGRRGSSSSSSSNLTVVKKNKVRSSPSVESEVEKKKKKKSGKQPVRQAKRGATVTKQHIQPVKKRIASSAPASTPPEKRARKSPESKRATAKPPPPPAAAKKPRPRRR